MVRELNLSTKLEIQRAYTLDEVSANTATQLEYTTKEALRTKSLTLQGVEKLLLQLGIPKSDIEAEKK